jgi:hypothetical protein
MATTFQHKKVQSIAIVIERRWGDEETVTLRSREQRATTSDWFMYGYDHKREFASRKEAMETARNVCPIFHGSDGDYADIQTFAVDPWGGWFSV